VKSLSALSIPEFTELAYLNDTARNEKLNDIAALPVTEIMEIES